jgi:hypothetical protein
MSILLCLYIHTLYLHSNAYLTCLLVHVFDDQAYVGVSGEADRRLENIETSLIGTP